jgi:hypothetical protein
MLMSSSAPRARDVQLSRRANSASRSRLLKEVIGTLRERPAFAKLRRVRRSLKGGGGSEPARMGRPPRARSEGSERAEEAREH